MSKERYCIMLQTLLVIRADVKRASLEFCQHAGTLIKAPVFPWYVLQILPCTANLNLICACTPW